MVKEYILGINKVNHILFVHDVLSLVTSSNKCSKCCPSARMHARSQPLSSLNDGRVNNVLLQCRLPDINRVLLQLTVTDAIKLISVHFKRETA